MNTTKILLILAGIVVVGGIATVLLKRWSLGLPVVKQDTLSMKELVAFFKDEAVLKRLNTDENLIAVAVRKKLKNGNSKIALTTFNKKTNTVAERLKIYEVKTLDAELSGTFGDKDMVILR